MNHHDRLDAAAVQEILPLTPLQEGMLLHTLKNQGAGDIYWIEMKLQISGPLDIDVCRRAWELVAQENPMLRAALRWENIKQPVQVIMKDHPLDFINGGGEGDRPRLEHVPFRVAVERSGDETYLLTVTCHHILLDGWSTGILFREFFNAYESLRQHRGVEFAEKLPFGDFIRWSRDVVQERRDRFWNEYLHVDDDGQLLPHMLPGVTARQLERSTGTPKRMARQTLGPKLNEALRQRCAAAKVPQSAILYGAWSLMLNRYCGLDRLLFGTTVSGRPAQLAGVDHTIGMFINTIPLRVHIDNDQTAADFLRVMAQNERARKDMETSPITAIATGAGRHLPLFDTAVVLENYPLPRETVPASAPFNVESFTVNEQTDFNLSLTVSGQAELSLGIEYSPELFSANAVRRMHSHLQAAIAFLSGDSDRRLGELDMLDPQERDALLVTFNKTESPAIAHTTIHQWFRRQALATPDAVAVADREGQVSYGCLLEESLGVARLLDERGVGAEQIVAVAGVRCVGTVAGILGVLFAGGVYLPIEPQLPAARINRMLRDSGAKILLAAGEEKLAQGLILDGIIRDWSWRSGLGTSVSRKKDYDRHIAGACYVMYTSGSTGIPKGVVVEHEAVVNVLAWYGARYGMGPGKNVLQMTGFSFDPSIEDLFGTILFGGTVWIAPRNLYVDPNAFALYVQQRRIYLIDFIPAVLMELLGDRPKIDCLRVVISGGERLETAVKDKLLAKGYRLDNHYGPTETTVDALACRCGDGDVNLGGPVANLRAYVLDREARLMPLGLPGELCVAGKGVARGYLNNPELTAQQFVPDPFVDGARMYRTGDLARWSEHGAIDFFGRLDHQVKIRGQRIELAEVEQRIRRFPLVADCVVIYKKGRSGGSLTAFVVPAQHATMKQKDRLGFDLRSYLEQELPEAMIPKAFLAIESIPVTSTGKPDRRALDALDTANPMQQQEFIAPRTPEEQTLAGFWQELLDIDTIGIKDDFFKIGGNSLLLVRLYSMINKQFPTRVSVQDLFDHRTIEALAGKLSDTRGSQPKPDKQKSRKIEF